MRRTAAIVVLALTLAGICGLAVGGGRSPLTWSGWRQATCMPDACFCEAPRDSAVRQPANAWSSLAFCTAGFLALVFLPMRENSPAWPRLLFALATVLIGLGSAFFHASLTFIGQTFDVLGMYVLGTLLLLLSVSKRQRLSPLIAIVIYVAGNAALLALLVLVPELRRYVFAALILAVLILERRALATKPQRGESRFLIGSLAAIAVAFGFWIADITHGLCDPSSWAQGHAVWHLLGAGASILVFRYLEPREPRIEYRALKVS